MIIKADRIITGDGSTVLEDMAVSINDGVIAEIGTLHQLKSKSPHAPVVEYKGATLMPGLIDMHVHIGYWWSKPDANTYNDFMIAFMAAKYAQTAFAQGVTTIRDVSSPGFLCETMNRAVKKRYLELPRIIGSDLGLCMTGGHSASKGKDGCIEVDGPWAVRAAIREAIKRGAQWIKLMASHRSDTPEFNQEELDAAVDECHRVGKKVAVHAGTQPSIQMCIDAGFDTIEHATYLTVEQALQMKEKGLAWVPTITAYTLSYEHILEVSKNADNEGNAVENSLITHHVYFRDAAKAYADNFRALSETGVKIATGTDVVYNNGPVTPVTTEMKYMTQDGMAPLKVIHCATLSGAQILGKDNEFGEIACGKAADLLLVQGNPLESMAVMDAIQAVYYGGKPVYKALTSEGDCRRPDR